MINTIITVLIAFLIGSIPCGYLLTKKYSKIDIREHGSGNTGSTNVERIAGKRLAKITQVLDVLKGFVPTLIVFLIVKYNLLYFNTDYIVLLTALAAILGHDFSPFLKFKGGKGVNTTLGVSLVIDPITALLSLAVFILVKKIFKYTSLGSICSAVALPLFSFLLNGMTEEFVFFVVVGLLMLFKHRNNIKRLITHTENL
jgi:acyl phosphate:glycerol-3-phosphate acyltransferase